MSVRLACRVAGRRALPWLAALAIVIAGCGGGTSPDGGESSGGGGNPQTPPVASEVPTPIAASPSPSVGDLVAEIIAGVKTNTANTVSGVSAAPLPQSFSDYLAGRSIAPHPIDRGNPLVSAVCKLVAVPRADRVLEGVVGLILDRLRIERDVEGIGMLVTAADAGCKALVPVLSAQIQLDDPAPRPTHRPSTPPISVAQLGKVVRVTEGSGGRPLLDIVVDAVRCNTRLGPYAAEPGNRFLGVELTIKALSDAQAYDPFYWTLEADGRPGRLVLNLDKGWSPPLDFGVLNTGQSVHGWLAYHVPDPKSSIVVTYRGNPYTMLPLFRVNFGACT